MGDLVSDDWCILTKSLFISLSGSETNEHYKINLKVHTLIFFQAIDNQGLLHCSSCRESVGVRDEKDRYSLRLFKWSVALQRSRASEWETCSVQEIVSAQLLALIDVLAAYKFLAIAGDAGNSKTALLVGGYSRPLPNACILAYSQTALGLHP